MPILEMMRFALDENDLAMLAIISERYKLVRKISAVKQAGNMPILQKDQYDKKIDILLKSAAREGLNSDFVASLFNLIHTESVRLQEELRSESSHNTSKLTTNGQ